MISTYSKYTTLNVIYGIFFFDTPVCILHLENISINACDIFSVQCLHVCSRFELDRAVLEE